MPEFQGKLLSANRIQQRCKVSNLPVDLKISHTIPSHFNEDIVKAHFDLNQTIDGIRSEPAINRNTPTQDLDS
jgi:hypothetical protein